MARELPHQMTPRWQRRDRKSTRLNSSHSQISYAVFCLKKKKKKQIVLLTKNKPGEIVEFITTVCLQEPESLKRTVSSYKVTVVGSLLLYSSQHFEAASV